MAAQYSTTDLLGNLETYEKNFSEYDLDKSAKIIAEIRTCLSNTIDEKNTKLEEKFNDLVKITKNNHSDPYQKKVFEYMLSIKLKACNGGNFSSITTPSMIESSRFRTYQQVYAFDFFSMLDKCMITNEEKILGYSYFYLAISGLYRHSVSDCYTFEKISRSENIEDIKIAKMDIHNFQNYFKCNAIKVPYFEGWNKIIRNAVAHCTFMRNGNNMRFIDNNLHKQETCEKIVSLGELDDLIGKIRTVIIGNSFTTYILLVKEIINVLIKR